MKNEAIVKKFIIDQELADAKEHTDRIADEFESLIDMVECKREEKDYEWMSDIFIPEFTSIILTDASDWASQYFQTREFVEVKLDNEVPEDEKKAKAAKRFINATLNVKDIHHFVKYIRARTINTLVGNVYLLCWWDKETREETIGYEEVENPSEEMLDNPLFEAPPEKKPIIEKHIIRDHFNYDVIDPRNVFVDNKYSYSVQDKDWIIIRSEQTISSLYKNKLSHGYINLDKLSEKIPNETETSKETFNSENSITDSNFNRYIDVYERYGTFPCKVNKRDEKGRPVEIEACLDKDGNIDWEKAELVECIITFGYNGSNYHLIRFQPTPFYDSNDEPYKPIVRGICYIHPTKDVGMSDGKYMRELQVALNDTFNMSSDRTKLATIPTLKGRRNSVDDNDSIYIAPGNIMSLEDPNDVMEFKMTDNIQGSMHQMQMLSTYMQSISAKSGTFQGQLPQRASQTATAVSESSSRGNTRTNYKSLTIEHTLLSNLYWMILQMANQFLEQETADKVLKELVPYFDPDADYTYSPITSSIEQEYSKMRKLQLIDQFVARLAPLQNPNTLKVINYLLSKAFELFGNEFPEYKKYLLDENAPPPMPTSQNNSGQIVGTGGIPNSNQNGLPQSGMEQEVRAGMNGI